jgi:hypothetical protein
VLGVGSIIFGTLNFISDSRKLFDQPRINPLDAVLLMPGLVIVAVSACVYNTWTYAIGPTLNFVNSGFWYCVDGVQNIFRAHDHPAPNNIEFALQPVQRQDAGRALVDHPVVRFNNVPIYID